MSRHPRPWTPALERRARAMRDAGANWGEISRQVGITRERLKYRLDPVLRAQRLAATRTRYKLMVEARGPKPPREPLRKQQLSLRLSGTPVERLEQLAAWRGLGLHAAARQVLEEALERDDQAEFT